MLIIVLLLITISVYLKPHAWHMVAVYLFDVDNFTHTATIMIIVFLIAWFLGIIGDPE